MIVAKEIDEYRRCDLSTCRKQARWEFTARGANGLPFRVYVCAEHQMEGFARAREIT